MKRLHILCVQRGVIGLQSQQWNLHDNVEIEKILKLNVLNLIAQKLEERRKCLICGGSRLE